MRNKILSALAVLMIVTMHLAAQEKNSSNMRVLVAYYSLNGNTQKMAEYIAQYTGADLLRIEPEVPYPDDKEAFVKRAKEELHDLSKVKIKKYDVRFSEYDVVFIGSPVWFSDWAAPAAVFARNANLKGKRVIPFMTSGKECPEVLDLLYQKYVDVKPERGLIFLGNEVEDCKPKVLDWVCEFFRMQNCGELTIMNVASAIREMKCRYPKITLCDIYKSFYQDYFGPGHIIESEKTAKSYIKSELKEITAPSVGLDMKCWEIGMTKFATGTEKCGALGNYVRVDLWKIKNKEINIKDYTAMLMNSVKSEVDTAGWLKQWQFIFMMLKENRIVIDNFDEDLQYITQRIQEGKYEMHHSKVFNECYHPHYRIIKRELLKP